MPAIFLSATAASMLSIVLESVGLVSPNSVSMPAPSGRSSSSVNVASE